MWGQIAQAIAKVYGENEETKRNAVDKVAQTADAGEGNNGNDYSHVANAGESNGGSSGGSSGGYTNPGEQDTSGTNAVSSNIGKMASSAKDMISSVKKDGDNKEDEDEKKEAADNALSNVGGTDIGSVGSDERLKRIFGDNDDAIKAFAKINAIQFEYNDKAKKIHPNGEHQVDDDPHYGVKAQDLLENPLTASTVEKDESGYLSVNTPELTMANSAVISEICKRLLVIEKVLGIKVV